MMLNRIFEIISNIRNVNSQIEKIEILKKHIADVEFKKFLKYCYDKNYIFGVTSASLKKNQNISEFEIYNDIFELCDLLISKKIFGKQAIKLVNGFINGNIQYEEILYNFFDKDLKLNISITQINKVLGNIIPVFEVVTAVPYDEKKKESYNLKNYLIERKLGGLRLLTFISYNNDNINIQFKTAKGKEITSMAKIESELKNIYKDSIYYGSDIILDGKVCIIDPNGKEDWDRINIEAKRKKFVIYNPMYICFDILTKDEFYGFKQSMKYSVRYANLNKFLSVKYKLEHIKSVFAAQYTEEHLNMLSKEFIESKKWSGFILRNDKCYNSGKSTDLLDYKFKKLVNL